MGSIDSFYISIAFNGGLFVLQQCWTTELSLMVGGMVNGGMVL